MLCYCKNMINECTGNAPSSIVLVYCKARQPHKTVLYIILHGSNNPSFKNTYQSREMWRNSRLVGMAGNSRTVHASQESQLLFDYDFEIGCVLRLGLTYI